MRINSHRILLNGRPLYRLRYGKKIMGVCGGIADWTGQSRLMVRLLALALLFLLQGFVLLPYIALGILLEKEPELEKATAEYDRDTYARMHVERKDVPPPPQPPQWQPGMSKSDYRRMSRDWRRVRRDWRKTYGAEPRPEDLKVDLAGLKRRFQTIQTRLKKAEALVTSAEFRMDRELKRT